MKKSDYLCIRELEFHYVQIAINVACDGLNGREEEETLFSGSRDALEEQV